MNLKNPSSSKAHINDSQPGPASLSSGQQGNVGKNDLELTVTVTLDGQSTRLAKCEFRTLVYEGLTDAQVVHHSFERMVNEMRQAIGLKVRPLCDHPGSGCRQLLGAGRHQDPIDLPDYPTEGEPTTFSGNVQSRSKR